MKFKSEYVGNYYIDKNNNVYQLIGYCDCPSVTLERVSDKERIYFGVNGLCTDDYTRLVEGGE